MMPPGHKSRIARRFNAAAPTYDAASPVQRTAAHQLAQYIHELTLPHSTGRPRVLEIGCGSGHLTRELLPHIGGNWFVTDIAPAMVMHCRDAVGPVAHYLVMDGERPALAGPFDLIVSNLAAQWFSDLPGALLKLARLLAPGGRLALSTLGSENFAAWRAAHDALGLAAATPSYPSSASIVEAFPANLTLHLSEQTLPAHGADPLEFVRGLRTIGADTPSPGTSPLTPGQLRRVLHHVAQSAPAGICYHLVYVVAQRID